MNEHPYIPGTSQQQPRRDRCADCGLLLFLDGTCPNPTCASNTPTAIVEVAYPPRTNLPIIDRPRG